MKKYNKNSNATWSAIADNYLKEREAMSFPSLLVDELIVKLVGKDATQGLVLDYGAGSGTLARHMASRLNRRVLAYEPMEEMRAVMLRLTPADAYPGIQIVDQEEAISPYASEIDAIICVNVFDHMEDVVEKLMYFQSLLPVGGRFIVSIPHPIKNIGRWVKEGTQNKWEYLYYRLDGYLQEGLVSRNREDIQGNLIIENVVSHHRTISTYYNMISEAGFVVKKIYEPAPSLESKLTLPVLYEQAIRIPYFLVLECYKVN